MVSCSSDSDAVPDSHSCTDHSPHQLHVERLGKLVGV